MDLLYEDEHDWLWKENHILHYHVNDYGGAYMDWANLRTLPIGKGHVEFEKFFALELYISTFNRTDFRDLSPLEHKKTACKKTFHHRIDKVFFV